jgi:hypothetical protein
MFTMEESALLARMLRILACVLLVVVFAATVFLLRSW